jgi:outer membrane receptor protein involved in Fe transport
MGDSSAHQRRDGARSLLAMAFASVSALALNGPAFAQQVDQASRAATAEREFDIPAQPLSSALLRFADQSDLQILFSQEDVAGMTSRPVRGRLTPEAALAQLLPQGAPRIEIVGDRVVRTDLPRPQYVAHESDEEIVVTGTRIRGAAPAGSHVITIDREEIDQTGRGTVQDVLQTLPQNFAGSQNEATQEGTQNARSNFTYGSTVDLRGLGADATLTLVDGHRLAPAGVGGYIDISTIPLSAVERVEVLADGASAAYGADAVAGVVNLILRDNFEGAETSVRFGATSGGGASERAFSQLLGASWQTGQIMGAYEYRARDELNVLDRPFLATANFTDRGGTDFRGTRSNPGNRARAVAL